MEIVTLTDVDEIIGEINNLKVYIYGAKIMAIKLHDRLIEKGVTVRGFLVSERYENPQTLENLPVYRIEEEKNNFFPCVIVAMGTNNLWGIEKELSSYQIGKLILLHPALLGKVYTNKILSLTSDISEKAIIEDEVDIVIDDTSNIIIEPYAYIKGKTVLYALNHSTIKISRFANLHGGEIRADGGSQICIGEHVCIEEEGKIFTEDTSAVKIGSASVIDKRCRISSLCKSAIETGENVTLEADANIVCGNGKITVGDNTSIGTQMFMRCSGSCITLGNDNMLSAHVKITTDVHRLYDYNGEKLRKRSIETGEHVWVGMGAALLPGTEIGSGSVVGAASLVTKKIPENVTCAGNPARILKKGIRWER